MIKFFRVSSLVLVMCLFISSPSLALDYIYCDKPTASPTCNIAFQKIRNMRNPLTGNQYFDDGIHFNLDGSVFVYPEFHVAKADLDKDGYNEIVIALAEFSEETAGTMCKKQNLCAHYIFQDRNTPGKKSTLQDIKAFGPFFTTGIGLSTDEQVGGYRSLRVYTDTKIKDFDVYQYDRKSDRYFNISTPK